MNADSDLRSRYARAVDANDNANAADMAAAIARRALTDGAYQEAVHWYSLMVDLADRSGDPTSLAVANEGLGDVFAAVGDYPEALAHLLKALTHREETSDLEVIGNLLGKIGVVHGKAGELDQAFRYLTESLVTHRDVGNAEMEVQTIRNLGEIHYARGDMDQALDCGLRALAVYEALGDRRNVATTLLILARVYEHQAQADAAFAALKSAQRELQEVEDYQLQAAVLLSLGRLYRQGERFDEARFVLEQGIAIAAEVEDPATLHQCHEELARTLERLGNYRDALDHMRRAVAIGDAFAAQETQRSLAELQMRYDMERRVKDEEIRQRNNVVQAIIETQEVERHRIAGELHDGVGQLLAAVKMNLLRVEGGVDGLDADRQRAFTTAMSVLDGAVRDVRTIAHTLSSSTLQELGLAAALQEIVSTTSTSGTVSFSLDVHGIDEHLADDVELGIYRIAQELITNVIRHADATKAHLHVIQGDHRLTLMVEDNGRGFDTQMTTGGGMGRRNMEARVRTMNGRITFDSAPGHGTTVTVEIPIGSPSEHH